MQTNKIERLPIGSKVRIVNPRWSVKRGSNIADVDPSHTTVAELVSVTRYQDWAWGRWHSDQNKLNLRPTTEKSGYGFLVRILNLAGYTDANDPETGVPFNAPVYGLVSAGAILALDADYEAFWAAEVVRRAQQQAQYEAERAQGIAKSKALEEIKNKALVGAFVQRNQLEITVKQSLLSLLGSRKEQGVAYTIRPTGDFSHDWDGVSPNRPTFEVTDWGFVTIPVQSVQTLIELALAGQEG